MKESESTEIKSGDQGRIGGQAKYQENRPHRLTLIRKSITLIGLSSTTELEENTITIIVRIG